LIPSVRLITFHPPAHASAPFLQIPLNNKDLPSVMTNKMIQLFCHTVMLKLCQTARAYKVGYNVNPLAVLPKTM